MKYRLVIQRLIYVSMIIIGIIGCTTDQVEATARLTLETKLADTLVQSGQPVDVVVSADLSEQELVRVISALDTYQLLRQKWQAAGGGAVNLSGTLAALSGDYASLYGEYQAVRQIVQNHWAEYTPAQQIALAQYHARAIGIHESVQILLANQQRAEAVAGMIDLGLLIAKAAVL